MKSAVFIERDGFLIKRISEGERERAPRRVEEMQINAEILPLITEIRNAGLLVIATANLPEIAKGDLSRRELELMHTFLQRRLPIDQMLFCPHDDADDCPCRKPRPGQFREATFEHRLDINHSFVLSDQWQDAAAAQAMGITSIMIESKKNGNGHRDFVLPTIDEAVAKILHLHTHQSELFVH
ncbi:HAD-IIIA family hydrolase [Verrucomicrobia bacterium]|jgi:D-glycero-D-manno-heptose 1,7-bisphosphate phosphatase|nr:HAD-IIIA family hydrolase [Verrucomicrobiota bacterium]MDA7645228.1 HAD-IIIA family hydrolase [bacterium]MDA7657446.1 HAD-IIIA family hydrolase [Verrucomicrobiota bacterium]